MLCMTDKSGVHLDESRVCVFSFTGSAVCCCTAPMVGE